MKLDFNKTYNNVKFNGWSKRCFDYSDKEAFIKEIKSNNPGIIIVSSSMDAIADEDGKFTGFLVEVIGMFADIDDTFNYEFIKEFFEKEYFELDKLLNDKVLSYWKGLHCKNNSIELDIIEEIYKNLNSKDFHYKNEEFHRLCFTFRSLKLFDVNSSDTEGLSSKSIDKLIEYNNIIETFKNKFNEVKDEMAFKAELNKFNRKGEC